MTGRGGRKLSDKMRFGERLKEEVNIDLTPFIDVVLMLLLFFVVSATLFKGMNQLDVQLPEANAPKLKQQTNSIALSVDKTGAYSINGKPVGAKVQKLKSALSGQLQGDPTTPVVIIGDSKAPHQAVVTALEVVSECGVTEVQIATQNTKKRSA